MVLKNRRVSQGQEMGTFLIMHPSFRRRRDSWNSTAPNQECPRFPRSDIWTDDEVPFCISLEPAEDMPIQNVLFENIRIRTAGQRGLIDVRPKFTKWAKKQTPGRIENVVFRDVSFNGPPAETAGQIRVSGPDVEHSVLNVTFRHVTRSGQTLRNDSPGVEINGFVTNVLFQE